MPKEKSEESKKKVVIVEEVEVEDPVKSEETPVVETKVEEPVAVMETEDEFEKPNYLWIIVPTALLVGALVGGLITYFSGISKLNMVVSSPSPIATTIPEVQETPKSSPASEVKRDGIKVQILNGSGVAGAAGKAKTLLEGLGYKDVDTGNAASSDFATTEVAVKESNDSYLDLIINDLSKNYEAKEGSKPLSASSKYDIVITLGKK